jgi:hypothetical protein
MNTQTDPRNLVMGENPEQFATIPEPQLDELRDYPTKDYRPSNNQVLKEYPLEINFLDKGCVVRVGCKSIAFNNVQDAMVEVNNYVNNPYEEQQKWRKLLD